MSKLEFIKLFFNNDEEVLSLIENLLTDSQQLIECEMEH